MMSQPLTQSEEALYSLMEYIAYSEWLSAAVTDSTVSAYKAAQTRNTEQYTVCSCIYIQGIQHIQQPHMLVRGHA